MIKDIIGGLTPIPTEELDSDNPFDDPCRCACNIDKRGYGKTYDYGYFQ